MDERPASLDVVVRANTILAPVSGTTIDLESMPDPVFSQGLMGVGVGMAPSSDVAYAPVSGTVTATTKTNHAVALVSDDGAEVLVHVGMDTVMLHGEGFSRFVERGDHVAAGTALVAFDRALVAERELDATVVVTVLNSDAYASVGVLVDGRVAAGAALLRLERRS